MILAKVQMWRMLVHADEGQRPTLVIYGHGINTTGIILRAYVEQMFQSIINRRDSLHFTSSFDDHEARTDQGVEVNTPLNDNDAIAGGARRVATYNN